MKHWQKKELFHVKHYRKPLVFLHLREDGQSDPEFRKRDNAECAPESPAKPADLSAHVSAARPETARGCLHVPLVMSESAKAREESEPVFDTEPRVPSIPAKRSHIKKQKSRTPRPSTTHYPLPTNNYLSGVPS